MPPKKTSAKKAPKKKAAARVPSPDPSPTPTPSPPPAPARKRRGRPPKNNADTDNDNNNDQAPPTKIRKTAASRKTALTLSNFVPTESVDFVLTCGNGDMGQLGNGENVTVSKRPRLVKAFPDGTKFLQVVAGGVHTVVLTSAFEVYTTGCNDEGALGRPCYDDDGELADKDEDFKFRKVSFPDGTGEIVMISAGDTHTAALTREGSVFIWGTFRDKSGVLGVALKEGVADVDNRKRGQVLNQAKEPLLLSHKDDRVVFKIASGSNHIVMLTDRGKIFTAGDGAAGQLGRMSPHSRDRNLESGEIDLRTVGKMMTPQEVIVNKSILFNNIWVATFCCFAKAVDGRIFVWGANAFGQMGIAADPEKIFVHYPTLSERFVAAKNWIGFDGDHHILAADDTGKCYGIGRGDDCKLGQGEENKADTQELVEISADGVIGVAASQGTSFYWTKDGRGFAFGFNSEAELGLGVEDETLVGTPTEIEIRSIEGGCRIKQISANAQHAIFLGSRKVDENS